MALAAGDVRDAPTEVRGDGVLGEELGRADQQPLALEGTGEVLLRQRRALVGQPGLLADEGELAREALAAQCIDGLDGSLTGADDHDLLVHRREE